MSKSIITRYEEYSAFSGTPAECKHHCLFGRGIRNKAEDDGIWIPLTNAEHNMSPKGTIYQIHGNPAAEKLSKMLGQMAWEKQYLVEKYELPFEDLSQEAREAFRNRYGESWL
jgi:hypothetical protein